MPTVKSTVIKENAYVQTVDTVGISWMASVIAVYYRMWLNNVDGGEMTYLARNQDKRFDP